MPSNTGPGNAGPGNIGNNRAIGPALARALPALALLVGAGVLYWHSLDPRYSAGMFATAPNAMVLPRVLLGGIAVLAAAVLVMEWGRPLATHTDARRAWMLAAAFAAAALALPFTGFAIMVTALMVVCLLVMGERRPLVLLTVTAITGPGLWYLFHHVLLIRLPSVISGGAF